MNQIFIGNGNLFIGSHHIFRRQGKGLSAFQYRLSTFNVLQTNFRSLGIK